MNILTKSTTQTFDYYITNYINTQQQNSLRNRKCNMTMKQSLTLCQRRRPIADPIPAFVEQLKAYEKECRQFGHLTAVDNDSSKPSAGPSSGSISGGKRKVESESSSSDGKSAKKRAVGPSIGPSISIPSKGASTGPTLKHESTEKKGNESKHNDKGVKDKASSAADKKKKVIGPERPPVKAICPMKPQ